MIQFLHHLIKIQIDTKYPKLQSKWWNIELTKNKRMVDKE